MKVLVLTSSPAIIPPLLIASSRGLLDIVSYWSPVQEVRDQLAHERVDVPQAGHWDELLANPLGAQAILTCGDDPDLVEAVRQLDPLGLRILVLLDGSAPPATQFAFTQIWQTSQNLIAPAFLSGFTTPAQRLKAELQRLPRRIEITRSIPMPEGISGLSEEEIERRFFEIAPVLRLLGGEFQDVTSLRMGQQGDRAEQALITLTGYDSLAASWKLDVGESSCHVRLQAADGTGAEGTWDPTQHQEDDIVAELRGFLNPRSPSPVYHWPDLIRAGELSVAAKSSATRRRTIRLVQEEGSERAQFKSQMTAVGCGVLSWTLVGAVLLLFTAAVLDPRDREYKTAARQGFVLRDHEFDRSAASLNLAGRQHLDQIRRRWSETEAAVIVEESDPSQRPLVDERRVQVANELESSGLRDVPSRVVARGLTGQWFEWLMSIGWLVVFIPLAVFLIGQVLIAATRDRIE